MRHIPPKIIEFSDAIIVSLPCFSPPVQSQAPMPRGTMAPAARRPRAAALSLPPRTGMATPMSHSHHPGLVFVRKCRRVCLAPLAVPASLTFSFFFLELFAVILFPCRPIRRRLLLPERRRARLLQRCCECLSRCVISAAHCLFVYHALIGMRLTSRPLFLAPQCHKSPKSLRTPALPAALQSPSAVLNLVRRLEPPVRLSCRTLANRYRSLVIL